MFPVEAMFPVVANRMFAPVRMEPLPSVESVQYKGVADHPNACGTKIHILAIVNANVLDPVPDVGFGDDLHNRFRHHDRRGPGPTDIWQPDTRAVITAQNHTLGFIIIFIF